MKSVEVMSIRTDIIFYLINVRLHSSHVAAACRHYMTYCSVTQGYKGVERQEDGEGDRVGEQRKDSWP